MPVAVIFPLVTPPFLPKTGTRAFAKVESREVFLRCVELYAPRNQVTQRIVAQRWGLTSAANSRTWSVSVRSSSCR